MGSTVNGKHLNQVGIELDFNANTSKARKEIQDLQKQLDNVISVASRGSVGVDKSLVKDLREASVAASSLKVHLQEATNVKTGQLDLSKLNNSFKQAGMTLSKYQESLSKIGQSGKMAFDSLAQSILKAEIPLKQSTGILHEFGITLKNTARWQISSSILHGFMGSIQTAYHYAEDLNRSLNNIRIVTGQNTDQIANFAKQANEAAKALSTTTTKYTDAALIYYQQGLSDKEVKERTDTTVKMANVARESAEEVSNQMTAVWNNFNKDGSEAAESFADKMTALGAATASSTSEIAEGLSKFSGIADTIGLSFDYATSALATVTATSRESADVVGTAFKTIFARIEGLKQGEVLEDGTELNKYSEGLAKIGVQIKDENGNLKNMDTILEDMGKKWQGLTEDQKIATAQTVAGVRQYNQLITLMDNWDFFQKNLATAQGSEGTLQKQADIYAESWEAARDRVTASAEEIYSQLLNDDFFIDLNNGFSGFLDLISDTIKGLGGLKGVLSGIGALVLQIFGKDIAKSVTNFINGFKDPQKINNQMKLDALNSFQNDDIRKDVYAGLLNSQEQFMNNEEKLNSFEKELAQTLLQEQRALAEKVIQAKELEKSSQKQLENELQIASKAVRGKKQEYNIKNIEKISTFTEQAKKNLDDIWDSFENNSRNTKALREDMQKAFSDEAIKKLPQSIRKSIEEIRSDKTLGDDGKERGKTAGETQRDFDRLAAKFQDNGWMQDIVNDYEQQLQKANYSTEEITEKTERFKNALQNASSATERAKVIQEEYDNSLEKGSEQMGKMGNNKVQLAEKVVGIGQAFMSATMAINAFKGLGDIWSDKDISGGEKMLSTITSLGMVIPTVISGVKALSEVVGGMSKAVPIFAAITAGIVVVSSVIGFLTDAYNADANAAKKAAEAAEGLKQQYEDLKAANEDLKASFEDYNSARSALKDMTMGTLEWKEAVTQLNEKVLDLINKYPELAGEVKNVNGVLELSSEAQQNLLDKQAKLVEEAAQANMAGQVYANQTSETSKITDYEREYNKRYKGAPDGSSGAQKEYSADGYKDVLEKVVNAYEQNGNAIFANTQELMKATGIDEKTAEYLTENNDELQNLAEELTANRQQNELLTNEITSKILEDKGESLNVSDKDAFADAMGGKYEEILKTQMKVFEDRGINGGPDDIDVQKKYAEAMNYKWISDDSDDKGTYLVNGKEQQISDVIAREYLAQQAAAEELGKELEGLSETFNNVVNTATQLAGGSEKAGVSLVKFMQGTLDYDELTQKEAEELSKLSNQLIDQFDTDQLKELGIDPDKLEEFQQQLADLPHNMHFEQITEDLSDAAKKAFEGLNIDDLSRGAQKAIAETLDKAFYEGGQGTVDEISKMFEEADKNGKAKEFSATLKNIDWDAIELDELKEQLSAAGVSTVGMDEKLQSLIDTMQTAEEDTTSLAQKYGEIHKIIDGLENGGIVSDEDYKKLEEASEETSKYFTTMLDGTHKLTGDAREFYDAIQGDMINKAIENVKNLEEKNDLLYNVRDTKENSLSDYSFESLSKSQYSKFHEGGFSISANDSLDKYQAQINIVKALGDASEETQNKMKKLEDAISGENARTLTEEEATDLANEVSKCKDAYDNLDESIKQNNIAINEQKIAIAMTAKNLDELNSMLEKGTINEIAYAEAQKAMHDSERMEDLDSEEITEYGKHLQDLAESEKVAYIGADKLSSELKNNSEAAKDISIQIARMNGAVETLADNWEDWSSILKKSSRGSQEYFKASVGVKKALADLFDVSEDYISLDLVDEFAADEKAMDLMAKAAKGDGDAIDELRKLAEDDIIAKIRLDSNIDTDAFDELVNPLVKQLEEKSIKMKVGAELDDSELISALNEMIAATGMTEAQVNDLLSGIGFSANFASEDQTVEAKIPITKKHHEVTNMTPVPMYDDKGFQTGMAYNYDETETVETIYSDETTTIPAWAMEAAPPGTRVTPKINSISKKANGGANNFSKSNKGGKGPGKSGGGKKGGGGKGKKNQKVQPKQYQDEFDVYGELNHAIKDLDHTLNNLGKQYDYVFGKERIKNLEKQNKAIKEQSAYVRQLIKAEQKNQNRLISHKKKNNKTGKMEEIGLKRYGGKFDKKGELLNYKDMTTKQWKIWNDARKKFNHSERTDKDKKEFDKVDKKYEQFKKLLNDYESLHQKIQEDQEKQKELIRQTVENNFERWKLELDVKLDTRKAKREWKTFTANMKAFTKDFGKQFSNSFQIKAKSNKSNFDSLNKDLNDLISKREELASISTKEGYKNYAKDTKKKDRIASSASEAKEKMKELDEQIMQTTQDMEELLNSSWDLLIDRLNQTQEQFDLINERLERQGDILEYNKQLIELQYGDNIYNDKAYSQMENYYQAENTYLQQRASDLKEEQVYWDREFNNAVAAAQARDEAIDVNDISTWTQDMVLAWKNANQAAGEYEQTTLDIIKNQKEMAETAINKAIYDAQVATYGMEFDEYVEQWERAKEVQNRYLDDIEKIYHIETLMNKVDQEIAKTTNAKNIARLKKFREDELKKLSECAKLTKYQVDAANARYEIALKEMALEDAKNNKNSMKLSRNEEGNWSYQYVADADEVLKKQQELRDAQFNLHELAKKEKEDMEQESINSMKRYWEKTREAALLTLTDEEKGAEKLRKAAEELNEDLEYTNKLIEESKLDQYAADLSMVVTTRVQNPEDLKKINSDASQLADDTIGLFGTDVTLAEVYTAFGGYGEDAAKAFLAGFTGENGEEGSDIFEKIRSSAETNFSTGDQSLDKIVSTMSSNIKDYISGKPTSLDNAFIDLYEVIDPNGEKSTLKQYQSVVSGFFNQIDSSIANVVNEITGNKGYQQAVQKVSGDSEKDTKALRETIKNIKEKWEKAIDKVEEYQKKVKKIKSKTITITVKYKEIGRPSSLDGPSERSVDAPSDGGGGSGGGSSSSGGSSGSGGSNNSKSAHYKVTYSNRILASGFNNKDQAQAKINEKQGYYNGLYQRWQHAGGPALSKEQADERVAWINAKIEKYKTGGYTGSWDGNNGRLAILHQKELVLNQEDTSNILDAINTIRDISSLNSSISESIAGSISDIFANSVKNAYNQTINSNTQKQNETYTIENITAEFPNAQNVDDIREAIMSLPRLASQYIARNLK